MNTKAFILIPLVAALVACGGGNSNDTTSASEGTVSVLITDNLTLDYSEVWVSVQSINATDSNGTVVSLYQDTTGQAHNLSQLVNVGALVDAQAIAADTYSTFEVVLTNDVKLVDLTGTIINATFDPTANPTYTINVTGSLTVDANQTSTLALDFDLAQFTYDLASNTVTPVVVQKDPATLAQTVITTQGSVQAINSPTQFVVTPVTGGADMTVNLHNTATVTNTATGAVAADTTALQVGMNISISGAYHATTLVITASNVQIDNSVVSVRHEVEGFVLSFDGSTLIMDVKEASFAPSTNEISVANVSNAVFSHGSLALISAGQEVEIKGHWDSSTFTAAVIEIEGARRNTASSSSYSDEYAEVEGLVNSINGQTLTLTIKEFEHVSGVSVNDLITIDSTNSWFKYGDAACLAVGQSIEVKGGFTDNNSMEASVIEFEHSNCSANSHNDYSSEQELDDDEYDDDLS